MEPFGYVNTFNGSDALELFVDKRVRYAAQLEDGTGLVAFDGQPGILREFGTVHMATQDFFWPNFTPKRRVGTGHEHFAIVPATFADYLRETEAVAGVVSLSPEALFVESDGPVAFGNVWSSRVIAFRDKRLASQDVQIGAFV